MYISSPPQHPALKSYVHSYHEFDSKQLLANDNSKKLIPDGYIEVWFQFGTLAEVSIENVYHQMPKQFVWGQTERYSRVLVNGANRIIAVRLYPWAARVLFKLPSIELSNCYVGLEDLNDDFNKRLEDALEQSHSFEQRRSILENHLLQLITNLKPTTCHPVVKQAFALIVKNKGIVKVQELASSLNISRQHLNRLVREEIGLSVKKLATVIRIRACVDAQFELPVASLTQLAHQFDFFDQSHFIRDFKGVTGDCPKDFFKQKHLICWHMNL